MGRKSWQPDPVERVLLGLVRGELDRQALAACDPETLTLRARHHKVLAPLAALVAGGAAPPDGWSLWAARVSLSSESDLRQMLAALTKTSGLLASAGISSVVLKGPSLVLGRPRDIGDADLLLRPGDIRRAIGVLEDQGYTYQGFDRNLHIRRREFRDWDRLLVWSNQFEFTEPSTGTLVELHSALFEAGRVYAERLGAFQGDPAPFLDRAVTEGSLRFLSLEDRVVLLALHGALKRSPSFRSFILRHLLDLGALAAAGPDWDEVLRRSRELGCLHHLYFLMLLGRRFRPEPLFSRLAADLEGRLSARVVRLVRLHAEALRGLDSYDGLSLFRYRLRAPFVLRGTWGARLQSALVLPLVFLPPPELARHYGVPGRSPWLRLLYLLEPLRLLGRAGGFLWRRIRGLR